MMINNPHYNIRLVDLLDMNNTDIYNFDYSKLYEVVGNWLNDIKPSLVNTSLFDDFIKSFCDRFYQRELNFDTFLDFKNKLRATLRANREKAGRMFKAGLLNINPLNTYEHNTEHTGENKGDSSSNSTANNTIKNQNDSDKNYEYTHANDYYKLHSDTPSDTMNVKDISAGGTNYVTDVDNTHDKTTDKAIVDHTKDVGSSESDSKSGTTANYKDDIYYKELQNGYDGHPADLINKYINLNLDVVNFYLDAIEDACLFSAILY